MRLSTLLLSCVFAGPPVESAPAPRAALLLGDGDVCHSIATTVTDAWCQLNCHAQPPYCPPSECVCGVPTPAPPTPPPPPPSPPTPGPPPTPSQGFGQLMTAYYSGIGESDLPKGAVNSLSLAFFAPDRLAEAGCTFTNTSTCLQPAAGAGSSVGQKWAISIIQHAAPILSKNTSPRKGDKPTFFFSFGGLSEGGAAWDTIFGSRDKATMFGMNAALLVNTMSSITGDVAYIGIDLDIEGAKSLPEFSSFIAAFRKSAPYDKHPLMICSLSGLMFWDNDDYFKLDLLKKHGPKSKGINFVNMMVDNIAASCDFMSSFWRNASLDFLPPSSRLLGIWGINNAVWIIGNPGCTTLFKWMKSNSVGFGVWQWWMGDPSPVNHLIDQAMV